jgi:hypothetical protein
LLNMSRSVTFISIFFLLNECLFAMQCILKSAQIIWLLVNINQSHSYLVTNSRLYNSESTSRLDMFRHILCKNKVEIISINLMTYNYIKIHINQNTTNYEVKCISNLTKFSQFFNYEKINIVIYSIFNAIIIS